MTFAYLDSSAFVKVVVAERESHRLIRWLRDWPERASCTLLRTEAVRAVRPHGDDAVAAARAAFVGLLLVPLDSAILDAAAELRGTIRSLDAIHLAAAQALGSDLGAVVTYDERMARAAARIDMRVAAP